MTNVQLTQSNGHAHCANLDQNGNGTSSFDAGHQHFVRGYTVQPAQGHTHAVEVGNGQVLSCGTRKPCNCGRK